MCRAAFTVLAMTAVLSAQVYFPQEDWRTATPESQGIDSAVLAAAIGQVREKHLGVHSLLVIRHGYVVADANFYPYDGGSPHDLASVTKTITSVITGIAVDRKVLRLDQPVLPLFSKEGPQEPDPREQKITIEDLLRMESGLDCGYTPGEQELEQMKRSPDWVRFALSLPMKYDPGTHASYCSPGYHLLGSAIGAASGMSELDFARRYLFEPLGIHSVAWTPDPQGRTHGWGDSHLFARDLAKIGYLYLHGGFWVDRQILPVSWIAISTAPHTGARGEHGSNGYEWNVTNAAAGRQFGGTGRGGQSLLVWPDLDMIVVSFAGGNPGQIAQMVRQAVKSEGPLPANRQGAESLAASIRAAAAEPAREHVAPLPETAAKISGAVWEFPVNPSRIDSLRLDFSPKGTEARVQVQYYGKPLDFVARLDGVYGISPNGGAFGKWTGENEFLLDLNFIANINHYTLDIHFQGDQIEVAANEASGLIRNGRLTGKRR